MLLCDTFRPMKSKNEDFLPMIKENFKKLVFLPLGLLILVGIPQASTANQPKIGTVQSLEAGDRACYVEVVDDAGQVSTEYASFEICDQDLVGRQVNLAYEVGSIAAESCAGDPACDEREEVMLIVEALVIEPPMVGTIQRLTAGDRACYVEVVDDAGQISTQYASFEICEQDLVGKRVNLTYEVGNILAASCQGNMDCGLSETVMLITQADVIEAPTPALVPLRVSNLPDGNYRYWTGTPNATIVSDAELLEGGGVLFRFQKQGNTITGVFAYVDGESICVSGQSNGNTLTGVAVETESSSVLSSTDMFANFGSSSALRVRRGVQSAAQTVTYNSTILNLNGFRRINAGTVLPPSQCF